ncbi:MAG: hypothetical protein ACLT98_02405 [Eggerthellaceae bacterium]
MVRHQSLYILMMFYTTVAGWMVAYAFKMGQDTSTVSPPRKQAASSRRFRPMPLQMFGWLLLVCLIGFGICGMGLQKAWSASRRS